MLGGKRAYDHGRDIDAREKLIAVLEVQVTGPLRSAHLACQKRKRGRGARTRGSSTN